MTGVQTCALPILEKSVWVVLVPSALSPLSVIFTRSVSLLLTLFLSLSLSLSEQGESLSLCLSLPVSQNSVHPPLPS